MDKLKVIEDIQECETVKELKDTIIKHWGEDGYIQGRDFLWPVDRMLDMIDSFVHLYKNDSEPYINPTRAYGIRQQLLYILYCESHNM